MVVKIESDIARIRKNVKSVKIENITIVTGLPAKVIKGNVSQDYRTL